jgi:glycosyltransferase involved in cell wall biosynthesis
MPKDGGLWFLRIVSPPGMPLASPVTSRRPRPRQETVAGTDVVLFMRHLGRVMAGGARAVLDRANLYARAGHRVTVVVVGPEDDAATARLRRTGALHPAVRVLYFGRDAPEFDARIRATHMQPLSPPVPFTAGCSIVEEPGRRRGTVRRAYKKDGRVLAAYDSTVSGLPTAFSVMDDAGTVRELWRYSDEGQVLVIDRFAAGSKAPAHRTFVVGGSLRWLEVDLTLSEGRGPARRPDPAEPASMSAGTGTRTHAATTSFAEVIARWLDEEFRHSDELVVMADGENTSQHVLRAMTHPRLRGVSILHNAHTDFPHTADAPVKEHWAAFLEDRRNVDLVVCLTSRQRAHLEARYPGLPLRVVHHAVPAAVPAPDVRRDPLRLVFVGRLAPQKRLEHLLDAFAIAAKELPDARLELYGSGGLEGELKERVAAAGLASQVTFRGFTNDPASAFASASAAVMTSRYEGLPLTLTEAMSVGTPFLAYDIDYGPAEVIRDGVDGVLVPPGDVDAMASAMVRVLSDPNHAASLGRRAREVHERFSAERYAEAWLAVAQTVLRVQTPVTEAGTTMEAAHG